MSHLRKRFLTNFDQLRRMEKLKTLSIWNIDIYSYIRICMGSKNLKGSFFNFNRNKLLSTSRFTRFHYTRYILEIYTLAKKKMSWYKKLCFSRNAKENVSGCRRLIVHVVLLQTQLIPDCSILNSLSFTLGDWLRNGNHVDWQP